MPGEPEYLTMGEAAERLDIDRRQLRRLIQRLNVETVENPIDARQRLIRLADLEAMRPWVAKKAAA